MPRQKKVLGYEDRKYVAKKNIYDSLSQVFSDLKHDKSGSHMWNKIAQDLSGCTMRLIGEDCLELTIHRYETTTIEGLVRSEHLGKELLKEVEKELKKRFKAYTGKVLELKKVRDDSSTEKTSVLSAEVSWAYGPRLSNHSRATARYLVRDSRVYEFDADVLE